VIQHEKLMKKDIFTTVAKSNKLDSE